jgi:hypothetical protein
LFFSPCQGIDATLAQEYTKGEGNGMYNFIFMADLLIEALDQELDSRNLQENEEDA